jgi:RNA polymerase sigma-70 factor, ECF subfamily
LFLFSNFGPQKAIVISTLKNYSDLQLWSGIQMGDPEMFRELHNRYVLQLSNQAYKILQDADLVKDLVQDAFLTLFLKKDELPKELNTGAWLTTVIKNKCLNALRDQHSRTRHHRQALGSGWPEMVNNGWNQTELRMQLNNGLAELSGKPKDVFLLRHHENKSYKEIATQLNISSKTVEKHINKAIRILRGKLKDWETN